MSLINDALRKARQAAAEHEERQPETVFRPPKAYPSRGPRRRGGLGLLVFVAAVAGLTGAALVWWTLDKGESTVAGAERPVGDTAPETVEYSESVAENRSIENSSTDLGGGAVDPPEPPTISSGMVEEEAARGQTAEAATPFGGQPVAAPPTLPQEIPDESPVYEQPVTTQRVFVLDADLGYASLSLGFIVARPVTPFAEINDMEVYVGSEVAGFVVEQIEADRVVLRDARGELVLKVR